jgi:hypothetical protein
MTTLEFYIQRGIVPPKCSLKGQVIYLCVRRNEDPCAGCWNNRAECGGRPRK